MTESVQQVSELPVLEEIGRPEWGEDLSWVTQDLFEREYQGLLQAPWGDAIVYQNDALAALRSHKQLSHQTFDAMTGPLITEALLPEAILEFFHFSTFSMRQPEHAPGKQLLMRQLAPAAVAPFRKDFGTIICQLIDEALERGEVDFLHDFAQPAVAAFWSRALEMPIPEATRAVEAAGDLIKAFLLNPTTQQLQVAEAGARDFIDLVTTALRRTAERGTSPLVNSLVADHASMTGIGKPDDPFAHFAMSLLDGFHSLGAGLAGSVYALVEGGVQPAEGAEDPASFASAAFLEAARLHPPVLLTARQAVEDFVHEGVLIPRESSVIMLWLFGNRDPQYFQDPMHFRLERPNRIRQFSFGGGLYVCAGRNVVQALSEVMLSGLARASVCVEALGEVSWHPGSGQHELTALPVRLSVES